MSDRRLRPGRRDHRRVDGERITGVTAILVLGLGLVALFLGIDWFWMIFVLGFAVVVPLVGILTGADDEETEPDPTADESSRRDALAELRARYARGELTDEEFEQKVERLLETETVEDAAEYVDREPATERSG